MYYENYNYLEKHFDQDHYLCKERECLEKKFVVFDSDIDMRAHDTKEHPSKVKKGKSIAIELNFQYSKPTSLSSKGKKMQVNDSPISQFDNLNLQSSSSSLPFTTESLGKSISDRVPNHFGSNLTQNQTQNDSNSVLQVKNNKTKSHSSLKESNNEYNPMISVGGDPKLIESLQILFDSNPNTFNEFKSLAQSFKSRILSSDEFLQAFLSLCTLDKSNEIKKQVIGQAGKVWIRLSDSLPSESLNNGMNKKEKKSFYSLRDEMIQSWNHYKAKVVLF